MGDLAAVAGDRGAGRLHRQGKRHRAADLLRVSHPVVDQVDGANALAKVVVGVGLGAGDEVLDPARRRLHQPPGDLDLAGLLVAG